MAEETVARARLPCAEAGERADGGQSEIEQERDAAGVAVAVRAVDRGTGAEKAHEVERERDAAAFADVAPRGNAREDADERNVREEDLPAVPLAEPGGRERMARLRVRFGVELVEIIGLGRWRSAGVRRERERREENGSSGSAQGFIFSASAGAAMVNCP